MYELKVSVHKVADEFYTRTDHQILTTLGNQAAVAVSRVAPIEELHCQIYEIEALSRVLVDIQERNLQRMAHALHDRVLQDLNDVRTLLNWRPPEPGKLEKADRKLTEVSKYLRGVMIEMHPPFWKSSDLPTLLADCADKFAKEDDLPVAFQAHDNSNGTPVPENVRRAVFRIFQECLNNAKRHARADMILATAGSQRPGRRWRQGAVGCR